MPDRHEQALVLLQKGTVIPAVPLVLHADRTFDGARQRRLLRYYLEAGVGGLAVAVHTTQFEIRDPGIDLFEPVLRVAAEEMDRYEADSGRTVIRIAGACGPAEQAVCEAEHAKSLGYDAVLLSPGGLRDVPEEVLLERTARVAAVLPVIGFYLQEAVGGRYLSFEYWRAMAEIDGVVAIKCASFDPYRTIDLVRGVAMSKRADQVALYTGNDNSIVTDLLTEYRFAKGGGVVSKRFVGGLLGHWSVWAKRVVEMYDQIVSVREQKDIPASLLTLAAEVTDCNAAFFDVRHNFAGCIAGVHEVLRRQGLIEGIWCLNPEETLSPGQAEEIDRVCTLYPHLNDDAFVDAFLKRYRGEA